MTHGVAECFQIGGRVIMVHRGHKVGVSCCSPLHWDRWGVRRQNLFFIIGQVWHGNLRWEINWRERRRSPFLAFQPTPHPSNPLSYLNSTPIASQLGSFLRAAQFRTSIPDRDTFSSITVDGSGKMQNEFQSFTIWTQSLWFQLIPRVSN